MSNTKISALITGNPAQSGDVIPIERSGSNFSVTASSIASLQLLSSTVIVSSAQILAMAETVATDVTIVPALGSGNVIVPVFATINYNYGGTAYTTGNGAIEFFQSGGGSHNVTYGAATSPKISSTSMLGAASTVSLGGFTVVQDSAVATVANNSLVLNTSTVTPYLSGNGTITVTVYYQIVHTS